MKLFFIRLTKSLFIRFRLHRLLLPFTGFLLNLAYLTRFSEWASQHKNIPYNDFLSRWNYKKRYPMYKWVMDHENLGGAVNYLEFGVADGQSFRWFMEQNSHPDSRFYGFDTFDGLPEDWGPFKKGTFGTGSRVPEISDSRGKFFKGLFQQTVPGFLGELDNSRRNVLMMDADLWSATLYALTTLRPFLKKGDIIFFDEFVVPMHEFKAYQDFIHSQYLHLELIAAANNYYFVAFRV